MSHSESRNLVSPLPTDLARNLPLGDLLALGPHLHADITPEELLRELAETLHRVVPSPMVYVRLRHPDTDVLEAVACVGVPDELQEYLQQTPVAPTFYQSLLQPQFRVGDSFLIPAGQNIPCEPNIEQIDQYAASTDAAEQFGYQADMLLVPLRSRGDRLLGVIYIMIPEVQASTFANIQVLEAFVRQAALALENVRLADRGARLLAKEQLLAQLGRDVSSTLELDTILERAITRLELAFNSASIALLDAPGLLRIAAAVGGVSPETGATRIRQGEGIVGSVAEYGQPYFSNNTDNSLTEHLLNPETDVTLALGGRLSRACSYIAVPLLSGGKVIGTINVGNAATDAFSYEDVDLLEAIAAQISGPVNSALLYQESRRLAEQVQRRADQLTVLNTLARIATATLNMEQMLTEVTEQIQRGFGYDHVELYLVDESTKEIIRQAQSGRYSSAVVGYRQHISLGILGRTVRTGQTQRIDDVLLDAEYLAIDRPHMRSELCVPIVAGGRVLGLLNLETEAVAAFTNEDVHVLHTAADILAGATENARLYQRSQEAAVLEERNRLARELHDSVTQQLFSMTLTSQAARAHMEKNPQRAAAQLERLQETSAAALAEMRALIFQLRPPALSDQGLVTGLQQHIAALSRREGLHIELSASGDERLARGYEQALYRIVQEALNNVVKHAQATNVRVLLEFKPEQMQICVSDNGQGFDPHARQSGDGRHLGLISMRERAAEIGGSMELHSAPGQGTQVIVTVARTNNS
jgi:signal transduction histidine kinase